jgi:hypothetical protein
MWKLTLGYGQYIVNAFFLFLHKRSGGWGVVVLLLTKELPSRERILCANFVPLMKTTTRMTIQRNKDPNRPIVPTPPFFLLLALPW